MENNDTNLTTLGNLLIKIGIIAYLAVFFLGVYKVIELVFA